MDELMMFGIIDGLIVVFTGVIMRGLFHASWRYVFSNGKSKRKPAGKSHLTGKAAFLMLPIPVGYVLLYGFDTWGFLLTIGIVLPELLVALTGVLTVANEANKEYQKSSNQILKEKNKMLEAQIANNSNRKLKVVRRKRKAQAPPNEIIWD